jgi:N-methylhydantoinase A/oxoprolinase/acetone carboxylase beta subunit
MGRYRLGCDVGGIFTDLLLLEEETGNTWRNKVHSTQDDQSISVKQGIDR